MGAEHFLKLKNYIIITNDFRLSNKLNVASSSVVTQHVYCQLKIKNASLNVL